MEMKKGSSKKIGSFGSITSDGNTLTIEIEDNSLGNVSLTDGSGRMECFWDGTQWVCNDITFGETSSRSAP
jgi:hypothetical protein